MQFFSSAEVEINVIYVDDDNTDGPWNGSIEHPFQLIQDAIDASSTSDVIFVLDGLYQENIIIDTSITLRGSDSTIIDGIGKNTAITVLADNCIIRGVIIINCSKGILDFEYSLMLIQSNNNTIQNNLFTLDGKGGFNSIAALHIMDAQENNILSNTFLAVDNISRNHAIHLTGDCKHTTIQQNRINGYDVAFSDSYENIHTIITNNNISENSMGLELYGSHFLISKNNIIQNEANGILIFNGLQHTIINNEISENGQHDGVGASPGMMLYRGGEMVIENNYFIHNAGPAIYIYRSYHNSITENNIINNGWNYDQEQKPNAFVYTHLSEMFKKNTWENNYWQPSSGNRWEQIPSELQILAYFDAVYSIPWYTFDKAPSLAPWTI